MRAQLLREAEVTYRFLKDDVAIVTIDQPPGSRAVERFEVWRCGRRVKSFWLREMGHPRAWDAAYRLKEALMAGGNRTERVLRENEK